MKTIYLFRLLTLGVGMGLLSMAQAKEPLSAKSKTQPVSHRVLGCAPSISQENLDINNVRAKLLGGNGQWSDDEKAGYEIPKGSNKNSIYAGAIWIGATDGGGNIRVAANTYGYNSGKSDFYPGPINSTTGSISAEQCLFYDKHFKVNKSDIDAFKAGAAATEAMLNWPGNGKANESKFLAPFVDVDGNEIYEPAKGDYPKIIGDQAIWWVFNDVGNSHTSFNGEPLGIEIRAMAFAYATENEFNDASFYKYQVINRGTTTLDNAHFGFWTDYDLGYAFDDYIGCDVKRSMGYAYNGDDFDESNYGYGSTPPAIGLVFLKNTFGASGATLPMSKFMYYNSNSSTTGDPTSATQVYNYLQGQWKDGTKLTYGGTGYSTTSTDYSDFMFPGQSDPDGRVAWSEISEANKPGDRRSIQSVGPFSLLPGAVNEISMGVLYARANEGDNLSSLGLLTCMADKSKELSDNDFIMINSESCKGTVIAGAPSFKTSFSEIRIKPNPVNDIVTISCPEYVNTMINLKIIDLTGRLMIEIQEIDATDIKVQTAAFTKGVYLVQVSDGKKTSVSKMVVY